MRCFQSAIYEQRIPDAPVLAGRSVMSGGERWEQNWSYALPALDARRRASRELGVLAAPSPEVHAFLRTLKRPVFVTVRRRTAEALRQADGVIAGTGPPQLLHHTRHDGLGRGGAEREEHLLADVAQELPQAQAGERLEREGEQRSKVAEPLQPEGRLEALPG